MKEQQLVKIKRTLQMRSPKTHGIDKELHFAVLVLMVFWEGEYHLVFEKRSAQVPQGGEVSFPGGRVEREVDRDSQETAIRETIEELGIPRDKLTVIGQLDSFVVPLGPEIDAYVGVADIENLDEIRVQTAEVEYVFLVPVSFFFTKPEVYTSIVKIHPSYVDENGNEVTLFPAKELGLPERYYQTWGNGLYQIFVYKYKNESIWGITARFINDLMERLSCVYGPSSWGAVPSNSATPMLGMQTPSNDPLSDEQQ